MNFKVNLFIQIQVCHLTKKTKSTPFVSINNTLSANHTTLTRNSYFADNLRRRNNLVHQLRSIAKLTLNLSVYLTQTQGRQVTFLFLEPKSDSRINSRWVQKFY